jgi:hypothetical protein
MAGALAAGLLASIFVTPAHARSLPPRHVATVWQTEQGLPQNSVYDMVQDRDGYLWLATWGGLVRFDGTRFSVFGATDVPALGSITVSRGTGGTSAALSATRRLSCWCSRASRSACRSPRGRSRSQRSC